METVMSFVPDPSTLYLTQTGTVHPSMPDGVSKII